MKKHYTISIEENIRHDLELIYNERNMTFIFSHIIENLLKKEIKEMLNEESIKKKKRKSIDTLQEPLHLEQEERDFEEGSYESYIMEEEKENGDDKNE